MQRSIKIKGSVMKRFSMYVSGLLFLLGCSDLFPIPIELIKPFIDGGTHSKPPS